MSQSVPASERLRFREYTEADVPSLAEVFGDAYARQFYPAHSRRETLVSWVEWNRRSYVESGFGLWALELAESGRFAGDAGLTLQPVEGERLLEIGYHVHPELRGQGLASEAAQACLHWAFEHTDHDLVCSIVNPANVASIKVAERVHRCRRVFQGRSGEMLLFYTSRAAWIPPTGDSLRRTVLQESTVRGPRLRRDSGSSLRRTK